MEKKTITLIQSRILELEDKIMDLIELCFQYSDNPIPVLEFEMGKILKEIEYLENLKK